MRSRIRLGGLDVDVVRKDIKNVHLSVYPPHGRVRIAAPRRLSLDTVRVFAISKLAWIKEQQRKFESQERETPREYLNRESHYVWGRRYLLKIVEREAPPAVDMTPSRLRLCVRPDTKADKRREILEDWYRLQLKAALPPFIAKWELLIGVKATRFFVQRMKTKWGSCNHRAGTIRFNTELAKKPKVCLEYIVVHELVHLREPTHNAHFIALMDQFMPRWQSARDLLNQLPVRHEDWDY